jgi:hypothetical protein
LVGLGGFEPPTSPLSGVRSNQLSYRPKLFRSDQKVLVCQLGSTITQIVELIHCSLI